MSIRKQETIPESGTSVGRTILPIWAKFLRSGEIPACTQKIFSSTTAASGGAARS